jgi:hypothetical protein
MTNPIFNCINRSHNFTIGEKMSQKKFGARSTRFVRRLQCRQNGTHVIAELVAATGQKFALQSCQSVLTCWVYMAQNMWATFVINVCPDLKLCLILTDVLPMTYKTKKV